MNIQKDLQLIWLFSLSTHTINKGVMYSISPSKKKGVVQNFGEAQNSFSK